MCCVLCVFSPGATFQCFSVIILCSPGGNGWAPLHKVRLQNITLNFSANIYTATDNINSVIKVGAWYLVEGTCGWLMALDWAWDCELGLGNIWVIFIFLLDENVQLFKIFCSDCWKLFSDWWEPDRVWCERVMADNQNKWNSTGS